MSSPPTRKRRWLRILIWAPAILIALVVLFFAIENWRGRRAWKGYLTELKARGDSPLPEAVIPPPVPDEDNFAATPLLARLFEEESPEALFPLEENLTGHDPGNWRMGESTSLTPAEAEAVLVALDQFDTKLAELRNAATRPNSRFPISYEKGVKMQFPHLTSLLNASRLCNLRAVAELKTNRSADACDDIVLALRMARATDLEPLFISALIEIASVEVTLNPIWQGVTSRAWDDGQLSRIDHSLSGIDLVDHWRRELRGERNLMAFADATRSDLAQLAQFAKLLASGRPALDFVGFWPSGWYEQNKVAGGKFYDRMLKTVDKERFLPERIESETSDRSTEEGIYSAFISQSIPVVATLAQKHANTQSSINLARTAIALERNRLKHGSFPPSLTDLDPEALPSGGLPVDAVSDKPFRYAPQGNTFILYSVGWNGRDNGGTYVWKDGGPGKIVIREGDWPWPEPHD